MPLSESVEETVGGAVIRLAQSAQFRAKRRAEHEEVEISVFQNLEEDLSAFGLGREHLTHGFRVSELNHPSACDARGMDNAVNIAKAMVRPCDSLAHGSFVRRIGCDHQDLGAKRLDRAQLMYLGTDVICWIVRGQPVVPFLGRRKGASTGQRQTSSHRSGKVFGEG